MRGMFLIIFCLLTMSQAFSMSLDPSIERCLLGIRNDQIGLLEVARREVITNARESHLRMVRAHSALQMLNRSKSHSVVSAFIEVLGPGIGSIAEKVSELERLSGGHSSQSILTMGQLVTELGRMTIDHDLLEDLDDFYSDSDLGAKMLQTVKEQYQIIRENLEIISSAVIVYRDCRTTFIPSLDESPQRPVATRRGYRRLLLTPPVLTLSRSPDLIAMVLEIYRAEELFIPLEGKTLEMINELKGILKAGRDQEAPEVWKKILKRIRHQSSPVNVNQVINFLLKEVWLSDNPEVLWQLGRLDILASRIKSMKKALRAARELIANCRQRECGSNGIPDVNELMQEFRQGRETLKELQDDYIQQGISVTEKFLSGPELGGVLSAFDLLYNHAERQISKR